jgi:hypothetical protein
MIMQNAEGEKKQMLNNLMFLRNNAILDELETLLMQS